MSAIDLMQQQRTVMLGLVMALVLTGLAACGRQPPLVTLGGTEPLASTGDLSAAMLDGLHELVDTKIAAAVEERVRYWPRDLASPDAHEHSVSSNRQRFKLRTGLVDARLPPSLERFGDDDNPALVARAPTFSVYQVRWPVLDGVDGEGLLLEPTGRPIGHIVALGDADQTPEMLVGLAPGVAQDAQFARRLAENGFQVVVPVLVSRAADVSGTEAVRLTNQPHREWLYRQAFVMGRHIIGYETQKILAVTDWFRQQVGERAKIAVAGYGEGGLLALYAAAVETHIDAALVSGYFDDRQNVWREPMYRNIWGHLQEFGDAEIASLVVPRGLVIEHSTGPEVDGPPTALPGSVDAAAPGAIVSPHFVSVSSEFRRLGGLTGSLSQTTRLISNEGAPVMPGSQAGLTALAELLGLDSQMRLSRTVPRDRRRSFRADIRERRQVQQIQEHIQRLVSASSAVRDDFFPHRAMPELRPADRPTVVDAGTLPAGRFVTKSEEFRAYFWDEIVGRLDDALMAPSPRSRQIYDEQRWTGHEVVLDVVPGVFAWGILLLPKDLRPGERRPVVVAQHGSNGLPEHVVVGDDPNYRNFAGRLADRGFIVFAPHNFYRDDDRFRWLDKKAKTIKLTMYSFLVVQHQQVLSWLVSLPFVDARRIGFYGLSYGGATALVIPPLLQQYALSICSANFNDDIHKLTAIDRAYSYMFHRTWEVPQFDLGNTFGHAEKAYLMIPRPFMVERGHHDAVGTDQRVAAEYAKVRWLYTRLGLADKTEIEFFDGGHTINGERSFAFLHHHLAWPESR